VNFLYAIPNIEIPEADTELMCMGVGCEWVCKLRNVRQQPSGEARAEADSRNRKALPSFHFGAIVFDAGEGTSTTGSFSKAIPRIPA
jgi:hypothetical protein